MALNTQKSFAGCNAMVNALCALANSGFLRIYDGAQPANGDVAVSTQVLLAELTLNATAFANAVNGVATANAITSDSDANATGTASWFRVLKSDGTTVLWDGSVGTATANLILNALGIQLHALVSVSAFTYTSPRAGA